MHWSFTVHRVAWVRHFVVDDGLPFISHLCEGSWHLSLIKKHLISWWQGKGSCLFQTCIIFLQFLNPYICFVLQLIIFLFIVEIMELDLCLNHLQCTRWQWITHDTHRSAVLHFLFGDKVMQQSLQTSILPSLLSLSWIFFKRRLSSSPDNFREICTWHLHRTYS